MPHLHMEQGGRLSRSEIRDSHLPTGPVSINTFLRSLIEELSVKPIRIYWELTLDSESSDTTLYSGI